MRPRYLNSDPAPTTLSLLLKNVTHLAIHSPSHPVARCLPIEILRVGYYTDHVPVYTPHGPLSLI